MAEIGNFHYVDFATRALYGEEGIDGVAGVEVIVVRRVDADGFEFVVSVIEFIDCADGWVFQFESVLGPVAGSGNH